MKRFYSQSTGCTYLPAVHGDQVPPDAVEISEATYQEVIANPPADKIRAHDSSGLPILVALPPPPALTRADVEAMRLTAYADPIKGSDRYFAEAQRESLLGNAEAAEAAKALGLARFAEIQAEHPWPAE